MLSLFIRFETCRVVLCEDVACQCPTVLPYWTKGAATAVTVPSENGINGIGKLNCTIY